MRLQGCMSQSHTDGPPCRNNCETPTLSSHAVDLVDPITPDTEERCASRDRLTDQIASADNGPHVASHHLLSAQSTASSFQSPHACDLPAKEPSTTSQCSMLQLPAGVRGHSDANLLGRPEESPGVAPHLLARAARCAPPSLQCSQGYAAADAHNSPSAGLRALVGALHATHRKAHSAAAISCSSADKLLPSDGKPLLTGLSTGATQAPAVPSDCDAPSATNCTRPEQPQALTSLNPARLHLDPAAALCRRLCRSSEQLDLRRSSPALMRLAQSDVATGAHGDALRSTGSFGRLKPARARRNTRDLIHKRRASGSGFVTRTASAASSLHSLPGAAGEAASSAVPSLGGSPPTSPRPLEHQSTSMEDVSAACTPTLPHPDTHTFASSPLMPVSGTIGTEAVITAALASVPGSGDTSVAGTPVAAAVRPPRLKPKKGAIIAPFKPAVGRTGTTPTTLTEAHAAQCTATPMSQMKRSISAAALTRRPLEADVLSALESGLVADGDVNVYGMRTPWHGLRHDNMHDPVSGVSLTSIASPSSRASGGEEEDDEAAPQLPLEPASPTVSPLTAQYSSARGGGRGLKRTSSCPGKLKDPASLGLVKPEYSRRNHKNFLDLYELGAVLGTGGYAVVRECTHIVTREKFAAKMMTVSEHPEAGGREIAKQALMNELDMMARLQHPNIVRFVEYFLQDDPSTPHYGACIIVMDLLEGPDMMDYIDEADEFTAEDARVLMRCLIDAVSHMHNHGISHRDLKLENLVFGRSNDLHSITVVDFGLAKAARARERMQGVTGTLWYTAPEILLGLDYSPLVDLWSLGVVMYLALTGDYPFEVPMEDLPEPPEDWQDEPSDSDEDGSDSDTAPVSSSTHEARIAEKLAAWRTRKREELLEDMICDEEPDWNKPAFLADPVATDLVRGLLFKDPRSRLSAAEALEHRWFTGHVCQDHATLKHVHRRISALCTADELPMRTFEPGEWVVQQAERACRSTACFLLLSGEAAVLLRAPASPLADAEGFLHLCNRRAGNFVGAVQLHLEDTTGGDTPRTPLTARAKAIRPFRPVNSQGASSPRSDAAASAALSSSLPLSMTSCTASEEACSSVAARAPQHAVVPSCGNPRSSSELSSAADAASLAAASTCTLPEGGVLPAQQAAKRADSGWSNSEEEALHTAQSGPDATATHSSGPERVSLQLRVVLTAMRAAKRWVGHRRTVGVRAVTKVVAVALSHDDMRWAVAHDFRMSNELTVALKARRLTVAKAIKAEKKAAKAVA